MILPSAAVQNERRRSTNAGGIRSPDHLSLLIGLVVVVSFVLVTPSHAAVAQMYLRLNGSPPTPMTRAVTIYDAPPQLLIATSGGKTRLVVDGSAAERPAGYSVGNLARPKPMLVAAEAGGAASVRLGQAGETVVRGAYDIGPKATAEIGGRTRIFDGLNGEAVSEVKNVASQAYTNAPPAVQALQAVNNAYPGDPGEVRDDTVVNDVIDFGATLGVSVVGDLARTGVSAGVDAAASAFDTAAEDSAQTAAAEAGTVAAEDLSGATASNYGRFLKSLPSGADSPSITSLPDGAFQFEADVLSSNIPGSFARYTKVVDSSGKTTSFYKTTYAPDGSIVHVKVKYP